MWSFSRKLVELTGLLRAYVRGDALARLVLADWLEERNDPRANAVREEPLDWDAIAREAAWQFPMGGYGERCRYLVECAREGKVSTPSPVQRAVREARERWVREVFPEAF